MKTLFSLRFHRSPDPKPPSQAHETVAGWLTEWGTLYLRDVVWKAFEHSGAEQFTFALDFVMLPESGRDPSRYVLVEVLDDAPDTPPIFTARDIARRRLLETLWPGRMLTLYAQTIRLAPDIAQMHLLDALE